ncbi:MAG: hypothetical protein JWO69_2033 [Thermoleophilia bacterium]|nr:hypothetical protein [Thermoleophilia bacterium]
MTTEGAYGASGRTRFAAASPFSRSHVVTGTPAASAAALSRAASLAVTRTDSTTDRGLSDGGRPGLRFGVVMTGGYRMTRTVDSAELPSYGNSMTTTKNATAGQTLAATLRKIKSVGPRTRRYRNGADVKAEMLDAIRCEVSFPGYYQGETAKALAGAGAVLRSWDKHVLGYRIDGQLAFYISDLTPYQFAAFLGSMVDAGIENVGQAEYWFAEQARALRVAA